MKFFENLPRTLKLLLHVVELAMCLYVAVSICLHFTLFAPYTDPYLIYIGLGFLATFPIVHAVVEICFGVPGTDKPDFADAIADLMAKALIGKLKDADQVEIKATTKPADDGPSDAH